MKRLSVDQIRSLEFNMKMRDKSIPAKEVFEDDKDMVHTLAAISQHPKFHIVKGQTWFTMCHTYLQSGWTLTDKQLTQCRRQSASVIDFLTYFRSSPNDIINQVNIDKIYLTIENYVVPSKEVKLSEDMKDLILRTKEEGRLQIFFSLSSMAKDMGKYKIMLCNRYSNDLNEWITVGLVDTSSQALALCRTLVDTIKQELSINLEEIETNSYPVFVRR